MKVVKPLKLGILHRTFEFRGRCFWTPCVMAFFDFSNQPALLSEIDMWKFSAEALGKDAALDTGMPKERAEVLVNGDFRAPGGKPQPAGRVRLTLGGPDKTPENAPDNTPNNRIDKTLFVFGDRHWKKNAAMTWGMSEPEPIQAMPVTYTHAFGGPRHKPNPLGKGMVADTGPDGDDERVPLPNIELPRQLVVSKSDKPDPAGFGPLDLTWPQRAAKSGTYDQQWYDTRFPGLADDIDWTFFNTAPEDQQFDGFFNGDEQFSIEGMHAEKSRIESGLPDIRPRCFITRQKGGEPIFEEVELHMDTLWLFPNAEKGVMIYHGLTEVQSDTAKDILHLVAAYEKRSHARRDIEHYRQALDKRLDREKGFLAMLDESDLIGEGEPSGFSEMMAGEEFVRIKGDDLLRKKQKMRSHKDIDMVRDMISQQGLDPDKTLPEPVDADIDIRQLDFDQILKDAEQQRLEAEKQLDKQLESLGLTREQLLDDTARKPAPRPFFSARAAMEAYDRIGIGGERIQEKMEVIEKTFNTAYRQVGHHLPPVLINNGAAADMNARKAALVAAHAAGESLKGADLAGMDLSGLDLEGIDLQNAMLEDAVLSDTNLRNANLNGAALMRSDLQGADLTGAALKDAGLGRALLVRADLSHADLSSAVLAGADLTFACLRNACLDEADLTEAKAGQADLRNATLKRARCIECDLKGIRAAAADLSGALIYKTDLRHADLTGATLRAATLVNVNADHACCRRADLGNLRAAVGCSLQQVDFEGAKLTKTNLRGGRLTGARLAGAELSQCDFSEADLKGCDFSHATAKQALFIEADLTAANLAAANCYESLFQKTCLHETDFKGANLFGVDFMKARFRNTDMRLALLHKSTLNRWIPK